MKKFNILRRLKDLINNDYICRNCGKHIYRSNSHYMHDNGQYYCDEKIIECLSKTKKCHICGAIDWHHKGYCSAIGKSRFYAEI